MTMVHGGFPTEALRDEHTRGAPERLRPPRAGAASARERRSMSSSVLYMSMSLDGFITGPDDDAGHGPRRRRRAPARWLGDRGGDARRLPARRAPSGAGLRRGAWRPARCWSAAARSTSPAAGAATTTASRSSSHPGRAAASRRRDWVHYVTDGVESAMRQAKAAAGDANVLVHGADLAQSCLRAGRARRARDPPDPGPPRRRADRCSASSEPSTSSSS